MATVNKIDSNATGLRWAEESSFKTVSSPTWNPLDPNSYSEFGGTVTTVARAPINDSRQNKKGVVTDVDATAGFQLDLTQTNVQDLMQGAFYADFRRKGEESVTAVDTDTINPDEYEVASTTGFLVNSLILGSGFTNSGNNTMNVVTAIVADTSVEVADGTLTAEASPPSDAKIVVVGHQGAAGDIDVDASGDLPKLTSTSLDFTTLGLISGETIFIGGDTSATKFSNAANNGFARIRSIAANEIVLDKSDADMVTEASSTETIQLFFGRVLKNEQSGSINRRTYQLERTLGAKDDALPAQIQSEYVIGAVLNQVDINVATSDKVTVDMTFLGADSEQRTGATGVKAGTRPALTDGRALNTSTDFSRQRLAKVISNDSAPTPIFAFITDMTISINNNATANKAVGTLGAFDITAGNFGVSVNLTAYFADVDGVSAVRNNDDYSLDMQIVRSNAGISIDIPLVSLGDGRPNVESDQPITLPLTLEGADGSHINSNLNHTMMMVFYDYLPNAADT